MINGNKHIPSLNGIRALAVLLVFFSHAGFEDVVPGGLGVTIFFFLSGYLITTLLTHEYNSTGTISIKNFYIRRLYRLFPPLYIVIALVLLLVTMKGNISQISLTGLLSQILHYSNYYIIFVGKEGLLPGLGILWSLAVEEHFYVFFPLFLLFFSNKTTKHKIAVLIALIIALVISWRIVLVVNFDILNLRSPDYLYTYYATDTRFDSILYGCLMALICNPVHSAIDERSNNLIKVGMVVGIGLILFTLLYREPIFRETIRYTIQGIAMFPIFYYVITQSESIIYKLLNCKPLAFIGKISYTFYLSHFVLIYLAQDIFGNTLLVKTVIGMILTLLFSTLMYYFIEKRFASLRKKLH